MYRDPRGLGIVWRTAAGQVHQGAESEEWVVFSRAPPDDVDGLAAFYSKVAITVTTSQGKVS